MQLMKSLTANVKTKREKEFLDTIQNYLEPGEVIQRYVLGRVAEAEFAPVCLLALTNKKLIRYYRRLWNEGVMNVPIDSITLMDEMRSLTKRNYIFYFPSGAMRFFPSHMTNSEEMKTLINELKERMEQAKSSKKASAPAGGGIPDQIRKLSELAKDGIITPQEFEKKKAELLERM